MFSSIQSAIHAPKKTSTRIEPTNPTVNPMAVPIPGQIAVPVVAQTISYFNTVSAKLSSTAKIALSIKSERKRVPLLRHPQDYLIVLL